jgi:hypothetical protein
MKAEQRKELETNALADRMGHFVRRVKTQPRRATLYYVLGAVAIFVVFFFVFRTFQYNRTENSSRWQALYLGSVRELESLAKTSADTNQGKAAFFQLAWLQYWEFGVKRLGMDGTAAMTNLQEASRLYSKLAEECEGDPVWEPEALYGMAVIEESKALQTSPVEVSKQLETAKARYEELAKKHPTSARGKLAREWVDNFDKESDRKELTRFYQDMRTVLDIRDPSLLLPKKGFDLGKDAKRKDTSPK